MTPKVYIVASRTRYGSMEFDAYGSAQDAVEQAKYRINKMSELKHSITELDVNNHLYYAMNLNEGIEVWVQERQVVFSTSTVGMPSSEWNPGWPPQ